MQKYKHSINLQGIQFSVETPCSKAGEESDSVKGFLFLCSLTRCKVNVVSTPHNSNSAVILQVEIYSTQKEADLNHEQVYGIAFIPNLQLHK